MNLSIDQHIIFGSILRTRIFSRKIFWLNVAEIFLLPLLFSTGILDQLGTNMSRLLKVLPGCAFFETNLVQDGYTSLQINGFMLAMNITILTSSIYLVIRSAFPLYSQKSYFSLSVLLLSLFAVFLAWYDLLGGIGNGSGLYDLTIHKPLALNLAMVIVMYMGGIMFLAEAVAQLLSLAKL